MQNAFNKPVNMQCAIILRLHMDMRYENHFSGSGELHPASGFCFGRSERSSPSGARFGGSPSHCTGTSPPISLGGLFCLRLGTGIARPAHMHGHVEPQMTSCSADSQPSDPTRTDGALDRAR